MIELFLKSLKAVKRLIVATIGFTLLLIGVAMIALPGPATLVIPVSLAILATEFIWAKKLIKRAKNIFSEKETQTGAPGALPLNPDPHIADKVRIDPNK